MWSEHVKKASFTFVGAVTKQADDVEAYGECSFPLKKEPAKLSDIVSGNKVFIERLANDALQERTINKVLKM